MWLMHLFYNSSNNLWSLKIMWGYYRISEMLYSFITSYASTEGGLGGKGYKSTKRREDQSVYPESKLHNHKD